MDKMMNSKMDLSGTWKLRWFDAERGSDIKRLIINRKEWARGLDVTVPGEVHDELIKNGWIKDLNLGKNSLEARWVEETFWHYQKIFKSPKLRKGEKARLVFEGLDLAAVIYLNGKEIGRHDNYFSPLKLDVTSHMLSGENELIVSVESGLFHAMDRPGREYGRQLGGQLAKRPWLRKTQSSFGWDWSPRLLNVGIHGKVYLEVSQDLRVENTVVFTEISDDLNSGKVTTRLFVEGLWKKSLQAKMILQVVGGGKIEKGFKIASGANLQELQLEVKNPKLWWPVGHGQPNRYTVKIILQVNGKIVSQTERKVGFRRINFNQEAHPETGNYFFLEINNKPIFVKGSNFVPADIILTRIDQARYRKLVQRALDSNQNFLRVWGGGLYEKDEFYDLCDEKGIMVWQEFIFACARYPLDDKDLLHNIKTEAVHQVRRLASRPSLIVWCGNNEMEWLYNYPEGERKTTYPDYALFHLVLPRLLKEEDPSRYYQPSSPFSPKHAHPQRDDMGDQHPWSVGFANNDFRDYRKMICRFPDEGGILGPTALPTMKACFAPGKPKIGSFEWDYHDNSVATWGDRCFTDEMLDQWLGKPIESMDLEDFVYYGGLLQGEGLTEFIKNFRRRMFDSGAAVFWMYNDCWPATRSWTIIDYYLRRTPSFHPVRRAFAPVMVVVTREKDRVRIYGVNEGEEWAGQLRFGLMQLTGKYPVDETQEVFLPTNASTVIAELDGKVWDKMGIRTHVAFAILSQNREEVARDRMFLPLFKEMKWPKAKVSVSLKNGKAIFTSNTFAWRVCLDLDGEKAFSDNFFDVYPGLPTVMDWPKSLGKPRILRIGNL